MNKLLLILADKIIKPSIVFESKPFLSDNTKPVYDEFFRRGYNKKYRLIWYISYDECAEIKDGKIEFYNPSKRNTLAEKMLNYSYYLKTKCIICCNSFLGSSGPHQITFGKDQISFYLSHGTPIKKTKAYYTSPGGIDYMISAAPETSQLMSEEFSVPLGAIYATGFPRNDVFSRSPMDLKLVFGDYNKFIIWYPTYRQNRDHTIETTGDSLPVIHNVEHAERLNKTVKEKDVLIVIKPHFAQDVSLIKKMELSNIKFIDDNFFKENNISSYQMLASSDALITDYSSVYYDYTLRDKPIAVIWEDIEAYKKFPGFAVDLDDYLKGAEKVYNIDELCTFVESVANNKDRLQAERREIRDRVNISTDGQNTKRVVDLIVKKANL